MRADVGHEPRRCLIKLLMLVVRVQMVLILIAVSLFFFFFAREKKQKLTFVHSILLIIRYLLFVGLYYMTELGEHRHVKRSTQHLFPSKTNSSFRRWHRDPQAILWHQPRPIFQSRFNYPGAWCASQENHTIDIPRKLCCNSSAAAFLTSFISKQPMNMLLNKQSSKQDHRA